MSTFRVLYAPLALEDLRAIYRYIHETLGVPTAAQRQINRIRETARSLASLPERYSAVDWEPWASMHVHRVPIDRYILFYRIDEAENTVTVLRVVYSGRRIDASLTEE